MEVFVAVCLWMLDNSFWELVLSFHHMGSRILNSDYRIRLQASLPTEPPGWPIFMYYDFSYVVYAR